MRVCKLQSVLQHIAPWIVTPNAPICIYNGIHTSAETDALNNQVSAGTADRSSAAYKNKTLMYTWLETHTKVVISLSALCLNKEVIPMLFFTSMTDLVYYFYWLVCRGGWCSLLRRICLQRPWMLSLVNLLTRSKCVQINHSDEYWLTYWRRLLDSWLCVFDYIFPSWVHTHIENEWNSTPQPVPNSQSIPGEALKTRQRSSVVDVISFTNRTKPQLSAPECHSYKI